MPQEVVMLRGVGRVDAGERRERDAMIMALFIHEFFLGGSLEEVSVFCTDFKF